MNDILREALSKAAEQINRAVTSGALPREAANPFRHTDEQRGMCRRFIADLRGQGLLGPQVTAADTDTIVRWLVGMGPLDPLLDDPSVISIQVISEDSVSVYRSGIWEKVPGVGWESADHLRDFATILASRTGTALGPDHPVVESTFQAPSGRVQIDATARTQAGVTLHIRLGRRTPVTLEQMLAAGGMSEAMFAFLQEVVARDAGVLIVGQPGSGKTTLLEALVQLWPQAPAVALDDRSEFQPDHPDCVLYNVPSDQLAQAFQHALRKNTTRIALSEVRGSEASEMLQFSGALTVWTTLHGTVDNAGLRLMTLAQGAPGSPYKGLAEALVMRVIEAAFPVIIETEAITIGGQAQFYISQIATNASQGPVRLFEAELDGPTLLGFRQVNRPEDLLHRYRRRVWGALAQPDVEAIDRAADLSPAAALTALEQYLRTHPSDHLALAVLRKLVRQFPEVGTHVRGRVQRYAQQVRALVLDRDWCGLLGLYCALDADPLVTGLAAQVTGLGQELMPVERAKLFRQRRAVQAAEDVLALPDNAAALIGLREAVLANPETYADGLDDEIQRRLEAFRLPVVLEGEESL